MSLGRTFAIAKGVNIPAVGLGTWQSEKGKVREAVKVAIDAGYRHIDAAWIYRNENEVGQGIKDSGIQRDQLWVTSKLWNSFHHPENVEKTLDETLKNLNLSYLDLYLMHWPVANAKDGGKTPDGKPKLDLELTEDPLPTWRAMESLVEKGKVRFIGVSNFTAARVEKLMQGAKIKPVCNQVELSLYCSQPDLVEWSKKSGVLLESYSPLGSTGAAQRDDPVVVEIAKKHKVDPANVLISYQVERGCVVLPKSVTPERIRSNFQDVKLDKDDMAKLDKASKKEERVVDPSEAWGYDIFQKNKKSHL